MSRPSGARDVAIIEHPAGEEIQFDWLELPRPPEHWKLGKHAHLLVGALSHSGRWRGVLADAEDFPQLVQALDAVLGRLGGVSQVWRFDRMSTRRCRNVAAYQRDQSKSAQAQVRLAAGTAQGAATIATSGPGTRSVRQVLEPAATRPCPHCGEAITIVALLTTPEAARPAVPNTVSEVIPLRRA